MESGKNHWFVFKVRNDFMYTDIFHGTQWPFQSEPGPSKAISLECLLCYVGELAVRHSFVYQHGCHNINNPCIYWYLKWTWNLQRCFKMTLFTLYTNFAKILVNLNFDDIKLGILRIILHCSQGSPQCTTHSHCSAHHIVWGGLQLWMKQWT